MEALYSKSNHAFHLCLNFLLEDLCLKEAKVCREFGLSGVAQLVIKLQNTLKVQGRTYSLAVELFSSGECF
ncbi:hypothetical protein AAHA92_27219 [Salvia divinorum]|uniref:Uncharacterized protein n=1 Tax=Salvia divinorum TaxID=28513 RepID=A0ABD1G413_SALDI